MTKSIVTVSWVCAAMTFAAATNCLADGNAAEAMGWDFKFKDFVIGAWWGPDARDAELQLYREAGFNVVMAGRYMQLDGYADPDAVERELDLCEDHGLAVMLDTYTANDRPWGGLAREKYESELHHPAGADELAWIHERMGDHPALIGYMIGDDQGTVIERSSGATDFLRSQPAPQHIPWLCGWIPPENLAEHHNPYSNPQIYPTLYEWGLSAEELVHRYCLAYNVYSQQCKEHGVAFWPMFNDTNYEYGLEGDDMFGYCPSDSLTRFPAYAAIAYGAHGIWYFTYNGGALQHLGPHDTLDEARAALTPLYPVAKKANLSIASWGPLVLGRTSTGLFGTAFRDQAAENSAEEGARPADGLAAPAPGKLVEAMDDDLLVGILVEDGAPPLAMVVDCRATKGYDELDPREVTISFSPEVAKVTVVRDPAPSVSRGRTVSFRLDAGEGQLLELLGPDLDELCSEEAIYAPVR